MFQKIFFLFFKNNNFKGVLKVIMNDRELEFGEQLETSERGNLVDKVTVRIMRKTFFKRVVLNGDTGFGEAFFKGDFETDNLKDLLKWFVQNSDRLPSFRKRKATFVFFEWKRILLSIAHLRNKNTKEGSKKNIKEHYDVSNNFYQLWLDKTMTYSSAVFQGTESLEEAQANKYRKICESIKLKKEDHLLEIGCGWGGFALFAVKNYGCKVTAITISKEQFDFAKNMIEAERLEDSIELKLLDYRDLEGSYDKIVSIEMMEALGHEFVQVFIDKCSSLLNAGGMMCFQCITYPDRDFDAYLKNNNFIKKYIFPGGELLSLANIEKLVNDNKTLKINSKKSIGKDYARTLNIWRENYLKKKKEIMGLGFSEEFFNKWLYYFVYCEVGFETEYIDNYQVVIVSN